MTNSFAQDSSDVSQQEAKKVIVTISKLLNDNYVFPHLGEQMGVHLKNQLKSGVYNQAFSAPRYFANTLTNDLQDVSHDKHVQVFFDPREVKEQRKRQNNNIDFPEGFIRHMRDKNNGVKEVTILEENIGYLNLTNFFPPKYAGHTVVEAMGKLLESDALIIDLRENSGGDPTMVQLISSFLFDSEPIHLNDIYAKPTNSIRQYWTLPYLPGKRRPDLDVYILTSSETFSAAEEFSYNLRNLKRATIVGETTKGGAHPGDIMIINDRFLIWVSTSRAINPISKTNWEGIGVQPHIKTNAMKALEVAHAKAKEKLTEKRTK